MKRNNLKEGEKQMTITKLKLTAIAGLLATAFVVPMQLSAAKNHPTVAALTPADLTNEARVIDTYVDDLIAYNKQITDASKRARLVNSDLQPLERRSADLTKRLSDVQNAVKDIIRKLKASGEWDNVDELLQAKISNPRLSSHFRQNSFKRALEESSTDLTNSADDISAPVGRLRSKISKRANDPGFEEDSGHSAVRFVKVSYATSASMLKVPFGCRVAALRAGIQIFVRGSLTDKANEAVDCACTNTNCFVVRAPVSTKNSSVAKNLIK